MFRVRKLNDGLIHGDMPTVGEPDITANINVQEIKCLEMVMARPKKVVHSKNPYKPKREKVSLDVKLKEGMLDGIRILKIANCELPEEVLKLDLSGRGYQSVYKNDLKYFTNILEMDITDNRLSFGDIDFLLSLTKLNFQSNNIKTLDIRPNTFPSLQHLDFSFNTFESAELAHIAKLPRLKT